ncbi:MAG TPA: hypothetical protein VLF87_03960, partial [Patescibacteria group bacterium]|nr:hypothetical protein [Patescibacteria group bacterium]
EEKLMELMGGESIETRTSILKKSIMPGVTVRQRVKNNWEMWGAKGLLMTHWWFEIGVSALIAPLSFSEVLPTKADVAAFQKKGIQKWFRETAREVAVLDMYENYYRKGWTPRLAYQVRHRLGPTLIKTVTLSWYGALIEAGLVTP